MREATRQLNIRANSRPWWERGFDPLTDDVKAAIREMTIWESVSFPNGSNYRQQVLKGENVQRISGYGYIVTVGEKLYLVRFDRLSVGSGTDFGVYYCSRDQALTDLIP